MLANCWVKLTKRDAIRRFRLVLLGVVAEWAFCALELNVFALRCHCQSLLKIKGVEYQIPHFFPRKKKKNEDK